MILDQLPPWFWLTSGFIFGAIIGSFLATLILRWPQERSILSGRSICDGCGRTLGIADLVPLLSALILQGRCGSCQAPINRLHFQVELACGLAGGAALWLAPGIEGLGWAVLAWFLITLAILDHRHFWLPDALTFPLAFLGFTLAMWVTPVTIADRVIGAGLAYGGLTLIALSYRKLRGRVGMGGGDPKLLGALGAWFGWQALPLLLLFASLAALAAAAVNAARGTDISSSTQMPFGTYMAVAALPAWTASRLLGMV